MDFMRAGGFGIWIVLLFGLLAVVSAVRFARGPEPRHLRVLVALSWATGFGILSTVSGNLAMVMWRVPQHPEWSKSPDLPLIVMTGIGEALTPAILGFTLLGVTWLLTAVGYRRYREID